jgi:hypothetical protein
MWNYIIILENQNINWPAFVTIQTVLYGHRGQIALLKTGQWNVVVVRRYEARNGRRIKGRTNIVATLVVAVLVVLVTNRLDHQDNVDRLGYERKKYLQLWLP